MARTGILVVVISGLLGTDKVVMSQSVTSVSPFGAEDSDGEIVAFPNRPFPESFTPPGSSFRFQEVHPSAFESLGSGPFAITSMAWRPDITVNAPISTTWEVTLKLGTTTTEPGSMSLTFADNYGTSAATTVFSGTMHFDTDGVSGTGGLPHDFHYVFEFDSPYTYRPEDGNLLIDVAAIAPPDPWIWVDGTDTTGEYIVALSANAEEAVRAVPAILVTQFSAVTIPEPSGIVLVILGMNCLLGARRRSRRRPPVSGRSAAFQNTTTYAVSDFNS